MTRSPIETTPTRAPSATTGACRMRQSLFRAMLSVDAGLDDVRRRDRVGVPVSVQAGDDLPGVVRRDMCSDAPAVVCGRVPPAPRQT